MTNDCALQPWLALRRTTLFREQTVDPDPLCRAELARPPRTAASVALPRTRIDCNRKRLHAASRALSAGAGTRSHRMDTTLLSWADVRATHSRSATQMMHTPTPLQRHARLGTKTFLAPCSVATIRLVARPRKVAAPAPPTTASRVRANAPARRLALFRPAEVSTVRSKQRDKQSSGRWASRARAGSGPYGDRNDFDDEEFPDEWNAFDADY